VNALGLHLARARTGFDWLSVRTPSSVNWLAGPYDGPMGPLTIAMHNLYIYIGNVYIIPDYRIIIP
jgi:hypothetical protein